MAASVTDPRGVSGTIAFSPRIAMEATAMTDQPQGDSPIPMIKEETVKDDGRTLIYYTFPDDQNAQASPDVPEAAYV